MDVHMGEAISCGVSLQYECYIEIYFNILFVHSTDHNYSH